MCSICRLETVHSSTNASSLSSVKPLVPLLSLLENDGSHHGAHHDSQQSAQQEQEDLPARERGAAEVSGGIVDVVCGGGRQSTGLLQLQARGSISDFLKPLWRKFKTDFTRSGLLYL